ncbi:MAG: alpha-N-acetylglucosaminidase TIM-barrel domain-containing protein [bacterium]|nr:alpha-N-acetylglucosaminidase TIM-barrel domain-containing protein [bacterium]
MKHLFTVMSTCCLASMAFALSDGEKTAAREVIARYAGDEVAASLTLEAIDDVEGRHVYEISENGRTLHGSSAVALCKAFYMNAKSKGAGIHSWSGSRFDAEAAFQPSEPVRVVAPYQHYQYFNVVTFGYTMPYWSEERWMEEIDWMALHGIDMPLTLIANEAINERVWKRLGLTDEEISSYFVGPAHLPWMRMGNLCQRPDAPQPKAWRERSVRLQHAVLKRMRSLGMKPVVQGFAGFVPPALTRVRPEAKLLEMKWSGGAFRSWFLSPDQELFREMGRLYVEEWEKEFGPCDYYLADSFNEMELPWKTKEEKLNGLAHCGANVFGAIHDANPNATWVMQGWMFGYQRHIWNAETLGALLRDVPADRVLLLDMAVDYNTHFWRNGENCEVFKGFLGRPWVWSTIPNMGGKSAPTGVLEFYCNGHLRAMNSANRGQLVGYGTAPEGFENNEVVYELITDAGWRDTKADLKDWLKNYTLCRYGAYPEKMDAYWEGMLKSVYGGFTDHPRFCWQMGPGGTRGSVQFNDAYFAGCQAFAECAEELKDSPLYQADLRETAAFYAGAKLELILRAIAAAEEDGNGDEVAKLRSLAKDYFGSIDTVLMGHPTLNLQRWIDFARACGEGDEALADYYETNARRIITIWGPPVNDYAAKIWGGLVGSYYMQRHLRRWEAMETQTRSTVGAYESDWVEKRLSIAADPTAPYKTAEELIAATNALPKELFVVKPGFSIGQWMPSDITTDWSEITFSVSPADLKSSKQVRFRYTKGNHGLDIEQVVIEMDGVDVQTINAKGFTGIQSRGNVFKLEIPAEATGNNGCHIRARVRGSGGNNSYGTVEFVK